MARDTLLDFFEDYSKTDDVFLVHDDGYRVRQTSYREVGVAARAFAATLADAGVGAGDKVVIWSENRTEWVVALWGCLLARAVLVPVDYRASADLLSRITHIVSSKVVLAGDEVQVPADVAGAVWKLAEIDTDTAQNRRTRNPGTRTSEPQNLRTPEPISPSTLAEIIFTSGATADPKGVTITHRNVLANIIPIEREMQKYLRYARPFHPIRFLNLLPLSHMFGQSMATFVPPMLSGTVVFSHGYSPVEILRQIKSRRISVLVSVPKVLDVLREHIERVAPDTKGPDDLAGKHWAWRWWRYRHVHRLFGWKFWCLVCGAAPLDPDLEAFWRKLGFLVVQGYGLTETAPIVTLNHPLRASKGTVGTPIGGVEVRIAPDGEILVRGENVTSGYYKPEGAANVLRWSDEVYRIVGLDRESVQVTSALFYSLVHPEDRDAVREAVENAVKNRTDYSIVHRLVRPNGEVRVVHEAAHLLFDENGELTSMVGTVHDITEQREVEQRFRQLAENIQEVFWLTTADKQHMLYVSPSYETIWGRPTAELWS